MLDVVLFAAGRNGALQRHYLIVVVGMNVPPPKIGLGVPLPNRVSKQLLGLLADKGELLSRDVHLPNNRVDGLHQFAKALLGSRQPRNRTAQRDRLADL